MSLISTGISLKQSCTIERDAFAGTDDGSGNPLPPGWQVHIASQPCRFWSISMSKGTGERVVDTTTVVVVEDIRLLLPLGTDVTTDDRVASLALADGTKVDGGPNGIRAILTRRDFLELVLVRIT